MLSVPFWLVWLLWVCFVLSSFTQLPSGALFSFWEGFLFKVNQPKPDALFSHGNPLGIWGSVLNSRLLLQCRQVLKVLEGIQVHPDKVGRARGGRLARNGGNKEKRGISIQMLPSGLEQLCVTGLGCAPRVFCFRLRFNLGPPAKTREREREREREQRRQYFGFAGRRECLPVKGRVQGEGSKTKNAPWRSRVPMVFTTSRLELRTETGPTPYCFVKLIRTGAVLVGCAEELVYQKS